MSWGPLFSPNFIKFNYSWSSSGGMFCERSGGLVCSFQIVIVIELLIFSPPFFAPNNLLNLHIETLLENYCVCQQCAHCGLPEIKIPVCWFEGICYEYGPVKSEVWGPEVSAPLIMWQEQSEGSLGPSQRSDWVCTTQRSEQGMLFIRDWAPSAWSLVCF